jgi:hypothetical protein
MPPPPHPPKPHIPTFRLLQLTAGSAEITYVPFPRSQKPCSLVQCTVVSETFSTHYIERCWKGCPLALTNMLFVVFLLVNPIKLHSECFISVHIQSEGYYHIQCPWINSIAKWNTRQTLKNLTATTPSLLSPKTHWKQFRQWSSVSGNALSCVKKGKGSLITWQVFRVVSWIYGVKRKKMCPKIHTPFLRPYNGPLWISKSFSAEQYLLLCSSCIHHSQPCFTSY